MMHGRATPWHPGSRVQFSRTCDEYSRSSATRAQPLHWSLSPNWGFGALRPACPPARTHVVVSVYDQCLQANSHAEASGSSVAGASVHATHCMLHILYSYMTHASCMPHSITVCTECTAPHHMMRCDQDPRTACPGSPHSISLSARDPPGHDRLSTLRTTRRRTG